METRYKKVIRDIQSILKDESDTILKMSTISALLKSHFQHFSWVGFYRRTKDDELSVGPYQGKWGCLHIKFGRGVCGRCAETRKTIIAPDVSSFPDHIACDSETKSEIVVPVFDSKNKLIAVLDIDSHKLNAFDEVDEKYLEQIVKDFLES